MIVSTGRHTKYESFVFLSPYVLAAMLLLMAKLFIITRYGNHTPWGDQWWAEAQLLFRPWLLGELRLDTLFSSHNEHRIFTSRVLSLLLFELNGRMWNPILQMQVNALLHVLSLGVFVFLSTRILSFNSTLLFLIFTVTLNAFPFGFANTLFGFQSSVYLLLLFGFIFLWCMSAYASYSTAWWLGIISGGLCVLSFASGAVAIIAGLLVLILRKLMARSASGVSNSSIVFVAAISVLAIAQTPSFTPDIPLKAGDLYTFARAVLTLLSWPVKSEEGVIGLGFLIIYMPLALFAISVLRDARFRTPSHYFVIAVGAWVIGQILLMAYGRGSFYYLNSRYLDMYAVGLLVGCIALLALSDSGKLYRLDLLFILVWVGSIAYGFSSKWDTVNWQLDRLSREAATQEVNVRSYLLSGDRTNLVGKAQGDIPYHEAEELIKMLDDPQIRVFLPRNIYVPGTAYDEVRDEHAGGADR